MFDPSVAVDAAFSAFGKPAVVQGEPSPRTILAIASAPDEVERLGRPVLVSTLELEIRASDMAGIGSGTRILVAGALRVVRGEPEYRDPDRLVAHLDTVPEA